MVFAVSGFVSVSVEVERKQGETRAVYLVEAPARKHCRGRSKQKHYLVRGNIRVLVFQEFGGCGFFANVLHEVENKKTFLQELKRISKPATCVVDVDWKKVQTEKGLPLKIRLSEEEATCLLSENGFTVTKQMDAGPKHYELICRLA